ncbi:hypothetical protein Tco_0412943 [Tanacetum coccineum]
MSDEPLGDDSKPRSYDVTFLNPLFDFNDDSTLCNDNPLFDKEFEDITRDNRFAMSSNNASSTVTYTSVSSDSNGPSSWGIPLKNADEIPARVFT